MNLSLGLRLVDEPSDGAPAPTQDQPKVFVRKLVAPPGWPWEQGRLADLDARLGSPLPAGDVSYQLKRLEPWRPGGPARFAAFYVLAAEVTGRLETHAQVDGRAIVVVFESTEETARRAKQLGMVGLSSALAIFVLVAALGGALARRAQLEGQLASAEQKAALKLRGVSAKARLRVQDQSLRAWPDRGAPLGEVLADIAATSGAVDGQARIEAFHWERGLIGVEARGERPPLIVFADQQLKRSARPIRRNVWLWAIEKQPLRTAGPEPIAAMPLGQDVSR
jgi:hypothetical protein